MKVIKIGFSASFPRTFITNIIMNTMDTNYSHTYIRLMDSNTVFEADWEGTTVKPYDLWDNANKVILEVPVEITDERYEELMQFIVKYKGTPYGYLQLVRILLDKLGLGRKYDNGTKAFICSELVARALGDILGILEEDLDKITPRHIFELAAQLKMNQQVKAW